MKRLVILGSTGSIGRNTLEIVAMFPGRFKVTALAAGQNITLLAEQIRRFTPRMVVVSQERLVDELRRFLPAGDPTVIRHGAEGYIAAAREDADLVVAAMVGAAGFRPTLAAVQAGRPVALANKETLVMAGHIVMAEALAHQSRILPIDSEHSAIWQCLAGQNRTDLDRIILTASGGPFLRHSKAEFARLTPRDALNHPNWRMGPKISVDSATLMNKGLEFMEARWLFDLPVEQIEVLIHPQSIVHSMVAFRDGAVIAQLGVPDMKGAIAYALSHPERLDLPAQRLDFCHTQPLTFEPPDPDRFPCLSLAIKALQTGGTMPAVLNAANEMAVQAFLSHRISFTRIPELIQTVMDQHPAVNPAGLTGILAADEWARRRTLEMIKKI